MVGIRSTRSDELAEPAATPSGGALTGVTPSDDNEPDYEPGDTMTIYVNGSWSGWDGKTVVKLTDGSVWQQAEYHYEYHYAYRPSVRIDGNEMFVEGMSQGIRVRRLR